MINIILCGGAGTRLWPISRKYFPKQFGKIFGDESLFQKTLIRNTGSCTNRIIVTNEKLKDIALEQVQDKKSFLDNISKQTIMLEPVGRNTAPAIALACMCCEKDEVVLVTPSDHIIQNLPEYEKIVALAEKSVSQGLLVTFGIKPEYPETGYGYIEGENLLDESKNLQVLSVRGFHEKPDTTTAEEYLKNGNYYWNSGMFVFRAGDFLDELEKHSPEIFTAATKTFQGARVEGEIMRFQQELMEEIPADSIDYAVMERSSRVAVIPADIGWDDLGSFDSLYNILPKDSDNNTQADNIIALNSKNNCIIKSKRLITTIDVEDLIIVDTEDALLICKRGSSQKVKNIIEKIREGDNKLKNLADYTLQQQDDMSDER